MNMLEQIAKFLRTIFVGTVSGGWVRPAQMGSPKWQLASGARVQMPALQNHPLFPKINKSNACALDGLNIVIGKLEFLGTRRWG